MMFVPEFVMKCNTIKPLGH
jgi:hypothetical protein